MANRVLIFSLAYYPFEGGAEIAVKEITTRLPDTEFDLVTLRFDKSWAKEERVGNVSVYRIDSSKVFFPIKSFLFARKLHKNNPYDMVWAIMAAYAGFGALFFKMSFPQVPFVLTLQEGDPLDYIKKKVRFVAPLFKRIFTKADKVQAISNFLADYARAMGHQGEVSVIPNGVAVEKFQNPNTRSLNEKAVTLITTSRLVEKNAVGDIIESLKFLPETVSLKIIGSGPLVQELKLQVKSSKLEARVEFLGHIPYEEIPKHLHDADIFVRPSLSEGFGNSFIEAMAAGLPVIATPVGGIVDFLVDGETGLFVEPKSPQLIAFQVHKLLSDPVLHDKIIINAKRMVRERYEWNTVALKMGELFNSIKR